MSYSEDDTAEPSASDSTRPAAPPSEHRLLTRRDPDLDAPSRDPRPLFTTRLRSLRRQQLQRSTARRRARKSTRLLLFTLLGLVCALAILLLAVSLTLRHSMRAALPQLDGTLRVSGLTAPVRIARNAQDVPSIRAASLDDLLFAQGFVTASDRLWQMDALRRHAEGSLAEILGPSLVPHDRLQRTLQIGAAADRALRTLPPDQLHQLEMYSRGVNAYIAQAASHLPIEFHLLHYKPQPWSPRDCLLVSLVMNQDLSTSFPNKLDREALAAHLPADLLPDLYPVGSWRDRPPTQSPPDLTAPRGPVLQIPLDSSQTLNRQPTLPPTPGVVQPGDLLRIGALLRPAQCSGCISGSNNWAVSAARSASGSPLLSNDMHLNLSAPDIWYEASLHATGPQPLDVTGFTLPGVPFVIVGRNAHVAWGVTNLGGDVQDLRIEHLRGSGPNTEFEQTNGTWTLAQHHPELIRVRGGHDLTLDVLTTTHTIGSATIQTPILSPLYPSEHRALSLTWTAYDPSTLRAPFLAIDQAADGASLVAAFADFGSPSLNLIYADDQNHIGYHAVGRIPIRGPALQHPRDASPLATPFLAPEGPAPPDGDTGDDDAPQPSAALRITPSAPRLVRASYVPQRHRRRRSRAHHPRRAIPASQAPPRTQPQTPSQAQSQTALPPFIAPPPPLDYTIGSPISPVPVDALDASQDWSGYIPYNVLPSVLDPASGALATANARITPGDYPYFLTNDWVDPYRVERIYKLLDGRTGLTPASMLVIQNDVHSALDLVLAQRLAYAIDHASPAALAHDAPQLRQAANLLRSWNGSMSADEAAPAIVSTVRDSLWPILLKAQIAAHAHPSISPLAAAQLALLYRWNERDSALEQLLQNTPARWLPAGYANWSDFLTEATASSLHEAHAPHILSRWRYGQVHEVEIAHPVLGSHSWLSRLLGVATGTGLHPADGSATTIKAIGPHFGPSERFTADLANPAATFANITTGESGNPASPQFLNQFAPWLAGTTFILPLQSSAPQHTLILQPQ